MSRDRSRYLRNNPTLAEVALWRALSRYRPRFTRQLEIAPYCADLACRRARLIVEVDGSQHAESASDTFRTCKLEADGWAVIRFWKNEVLGNIYGVVEAVIQAGNPRLPRGEAFEAVISRAGRERQPRSRQIK